ncbi:hypothetical protein D3C73_1591990 [compost metagenome]
MPSMPWKRRIISVYASTPRIMVPPAATMSRKPSMLKVRRCALNTSWAAPMLALSKATMRS